MSRIGKNPIVLPDKVQVNIDQENVMTAKGPKGELKVELPREIECKLEDNTLTFSRPNDHRRLRSLHGLTRSLAANAVEGVSAGFERLLRIEGVGYKAELKGERLMLSLGFSHPVIVIPPDGITFEVTGTQIKIKGIDKQLVGQLAAVIRKLRKPEPYKGKGVRYEGEYIRRKAGKTAT
ncbi:MAG: 50S ribosomal protein L6 [Candidatus Kapaibacterium sp.]